MPFDPKTLLFSCVGFSVLSSSFLSLRRNWMITVLAALFYGGVLWFFRDTLLSGLKTALYCVTEIYSRSYAAVSPIGTPNGECTAVLTILALPLAWITAWIVNREGSVVLAGLICAPILILCLTIVDIAPNFWLIVLTGALMLLLLTNSVRERDPHQGGQLAWILLVPTAAVMAGLIFLSPPQSYTRAGWISQLQSISEQAVGMDWQDLRPTDPVEDGVTPWHSSLQDVDLSLVGPKVQTHIKVLEYTADTQISYLRGVSLGVYKDNTWSAVPQEDFLSQDLDAASLMTAAAAASATVTVRTVSPARLLYTPYHMTRLPNGGQPVDDAYVDNSGGVSVYSVPYAIGNVTSPAVMHWGYEDYANSHYTTVPQELQPQLEELLVQEGLTLSSNVMEAAASVSSWLKQHAVYDLNTATVPDGKDFVLYFLTESRQGYCVHFATAAAMLLRTLDIPARYVTGYSVSGPEGQRNVVTTDEAHAWVEYYANGIGWLTLDPTPPAQAQPSEPDPTAPSSSDGTAAPNEPDAPSVTDEDIPAANKDHSSSRPGTGSIGRETALWLWLLSLPVLALSVLIRRWLILAKKTQQWRKGHPNRRCLWLWRQLAQISRITGQLPEEALIVLAEKARFSQHIITEEECSRMAQAVLLQTQTLKQEVSPLKRLWHKYFLVLY